MSVPSMQFTSFVVLHHCASCCTNLAVFPWAQIWDLRTEATLIWSAWPRSFGSWRLRLRCLQKCSTMSATDRAFTREMKNETIFEKSNKYIQMLFQIAIKVWYDTVVHVYLALHFCMSPFNSSYSLSVTCLSHAWMTRKVPLQRVKSSRRVFSEKKKKKLQRWKLHVDILCVCSG